MSKMKQGLPEDIDVTDEALDEAEITQGWKEFELSKFTTQELLDELDRRKRGIQ